MTRAHLAKILAIGFSLKEEAITDKRFTDVNPTSWYAGFVQALLTNKITSGTSTTTYSPNSYVTRGQLASFVIRSEKVAPPVSEELPTTPDEELPKDEVKPTSDKDKPEGIEGNKEQEDTDVNKTPENTGQKEEDKVSKISAAEIEQKYMSQLAVLEAQANKQIDALYDTAYSEYRAKRANGESIDYDYFYDKYMAAAKGLEGGIDASFYGILSAMEAELTANGYSTESTKGLADSYESIKRGMANSFLNKSENRYL